MQKTKNTKRSRIKAMTWSFVFIVMSAMILPSASYLFSGDTAIAQVSNDENQRSNFWRAVREGQAGYSAVSGEESGVFINNGAQGWREMRSGALTKMGGWAILGGLIVIALFYLIRGKIKLKSAVSGDTVPRWELWERIMHWYTAILFVVLAVTGLSMLFGRAVLIPVLGSKGFALWANFSINVHNIVGPFFSLGVFAMLLFWVKNNIPNATDIKWLASGGGIIGNAHPSAGKANGGEKVWYWIVIFVGLLSVCGTGFVLIGWAAQLGFGDTTRATMQFMHQIHAIAAIVWIVVFFGHVYIGTIGTQGALEGMTTGRVGVEWAREHHDLWYEDVKNLQEREVSNPPEGAEASSN